MDTLVQDFVFFENFCPKYPAFVGPGHKNGYLKEEYEHKHSLHAVNFR